MDADMVVADSLAPLLSGIEICKATSIMVCADAGLTQKTLAGELCGYYRGHPQDIDTLLGEASGVGQYPLVVNDGVFAGKRAAMLALDAKVRSMLPRSAEWVDRFKDHCCRNQFIFNLALASLDCAVELDPIFNLQLHCRTVERKTIGDKTVATWEGRPVHVLHYCGPSRGLHPAVSIGI